MATLGDDFGNLDDDLDSSPPPIGTEERAEQDREKQDATGKTPGSPPDDIDPDPDIESDDDDVAGEDKEADERGTGDNAGRELALRIRSIPAHDPELDIHRQLVEAMLAKEGIPGKGDPESRFNTFLEIAVTPRLIRNAPAYSLQLPGPMRDYLTTLVKTLSVIFADVPNSQLQRCLVVLVDRHMDEFIGLAAEAAKRQRQQDIF